MPPETLMQQDTRRSSYTRLLILAGILLAVLLALGWWQYPRDGVSQPTHEEFYTALVDANASFAEAERLAKAHRYAEALPYYAAALEQARNDEESVQIRLLEARTLILVGDLAQAATLLKELVVDEADPRTARARALAVIEIANIYSRGVLDVNRAIFADEPFKSLWSPVDVKLTLRHLYEYASSIYPDAVSELRVAQWYSQQLPDAGGKSALPAEDVGTFVQTVKRLVASADEDIVFLETQDAMANDYHLALLERAIVIGDLNRHGDMSLGGADAQFEKAIDAAANAGRGEDGVARYYYALFLAQRFGSGKKAEIQAVLAPLPKPEYSGSPVMSLLTTARAVPFFRQFPVQIAKIDPAFKAFLLTIGWTETDLAS